jgi:hypothetical protein
MTTTTKSRSDRTVRGACLLGCIGVIALSGCSFQPPKPWEKGILAKPEMTMNGDALQQRFDEHIFDSKEAASGGSGVGGGGCGCN